VKPLCTHRSPLLLPMIIVTHILMIQPPRMWDTLASSNSWWLCALVSILIRFSSSFFLWLSPDKNQQNHTRSSLIRLEFFPSFILIVLLTKVVYIYEWRRFFHVSTTKLFVRRRTPGDWVVRLGGRGYTEGGFSAGKSVIL
jgi:hypothetical protein